MKIKIGSSMPTVKPKNPFVGFVYFDIERGTRMLFTGQGWIPMDDIKQAEYKPKSERAKRLLK